VGTASAVGIDEAGALRSGEVMLSIALQPLLRPPPPPSRLPSTSRGSPVIRRRAPQLRNAAGRGRLLQFLRPPSDRSTPHTPTGSSALHIQGLHAFPGLRRDTPGSAPACPPFGGAITRRQDSLRCCGPVGCSHHVAFDVGLRRRAFPPDAANLLPGSLTTTRTGLSPAGGRKLADTRDHATRHTSSS